MTRLEFTNCADNDYLDTMLTRLMLFGLFVTMSFSGLSQTSDIFDSDIVEVDILFQDKNWQDTLIMRRQRGSKDALIAVVHIDGVPYEETEVRFKGNSSFHGALKHGWHKLPLKIKVAAGNLIAGRYNKLRLANNYRDPSAIRELLAYRIAGTYIPVPKVVPASVTINGKYAGLYTLTEGIEKAMIKDFFCDDSGILVQCEPNFRANQITGCPKGDNANLAYLGEEPACYERLYDIGKEEASRSLIALTRSLDRDKRIDTVVDVHQALWMHAINNVLVNLDSYLGLFCHNYFVYQDQFGVYHPLIWDLNLAFGGFAPIAQGESPDPVKLSPIAHDRFHHGKRPLIQKLTADKVNVRLYFWMMKTIVEDWITSGKYLEVASELQSRIRPYVAREKDALYSLKDFDQSMSETVKRGDHRSIIGIAELMEPRAEYLLKHVLLSKKSPVVIDWSADLSDQSLCIALKTSEDVSQVQLRYQSGACGKPRYKLMQRTGSGHWQVDIPPGGLFYFVVSSNSGSILYPSHAPLALLNFK
jgi:CotH kinase protein